MSPRSPLGARTLAAFGFVALASVATLSHAQPATSTTLPLAEYLRVVRAHHPLVRQARAAAEQADAEVRVAAGAFDPSVGATWERKAFGATPYYDYLSSAITLPTPLGVDLKLGYERAAGRYLNPDRRTPAAGLFSAGVSVPLGQRFLIDERRTALGVSRAARDAAEADQDGAANRALLDATRDYAKWYEAWRRASIAGEGTTLAQARLAFTRRRVAAGEAAPLDTVEALLEVLRRDAARIEAEQGLRATRQQAALHLWDANGRPVPLAEDAEPESPPGVTTSALAVTGDDQVAAVERTHPDVRRADARTAQAAAQQRLASAQRVPLPVAELSSLAGSRGAFALPSELGRPAVDDLKAGASVKVPLLFLRERGRAAAAEARLDQAEIDRSRVQRLVGTNARIALAEVEAVDRARALQRLAVDQARALVQGEQRRFEAGESTLFLVTLRERAMLDEAQRLATADARAIVVRGELAALTSAWALAPEVAR